SGVDGNDGEDSLVPGPRGTNGAAGAPGVMCAPGVDGEPGEDGLPFGISTPPRAVTPLILDTANAADTTDTDASDYSFTITDVGVHVDRIITAWVYDELDHVSIETRAREGAFDLHMHAIDYATMGPLKGRYNVAYMVQ